MVVKTRRFSFRAVHALDCGEFQEQTHGHHYHLEVSFDPGTQAQVEQTVHQQLLSQMDCRSLHRLVSHSTGEVLVDWIHEQLLAQGLKIFAVALQETKKNRFVSAKSETRFL